MGGVTLYLYYTRMEVLVSCCKTDLDYLEVILALYKDGGCCKTDLIACSYVLIQGWMSHSTCCKIDDLPFPQRKL